MNANSLVHQIHTFPIINAILYQLIINNTCIYKCGDNYSNGCPQSQQTLTEPLAIINGTMHQSLPYIKQYQYIYIYKIDFNDIKSDDDDDVMLDTVLYWRILSYQVWVIRGYGFDAISEEKSSTLTQRRTSCRMAYDFSCWWFTATLW